MVCGKTIYTTRDNFRSDQKLDRSEKIMNKQTLYFSDFELKKRAEKYFNLLWADASTATAFNAVETVVMKNSSAAGELLGDDEVLIEEFEAAKIIIKKAFGLNDDDHHIYGYCQVCGYDFTLENSEYGEDKNESEDSILQKLKMHHLLASPDCCVGLNLTEIPQEFPEYYPIIDEDKNVIRMLCVHTNENYKVIESEFGDYAEII